MKFVLFFRYTNLKEESEASSIQISNAEPIDSIVDGASALATTSIAKNDNTTIDESFYSVPAVSIDNALTEYTFVKEVKVMARESNPPPPSTKPKPSSISQQNGIQPIPHPRSSVRKASDPKIDELHVDGPVSFQTNTNFVRESNPLPLGNDPDLEIYSAASTLSLGETVILSDGWLNRTTPIPTSTTVVAPHGGSNRNNEDSSESDFILTLDVDTTASVI